MSQPRIGFIGVGVMGAPMAGHIARAGFALAVHDVNRASAERLASEYSDILVLDTPKEIAEACDIVITMLPSGEYVHEVTLGRSGLAGGFRRGGLLLDTSSSEPWLTVQTAEALSAKGIEMVDAPVSGAQAGARAAELLFMVGGERESVARVLPLLHAMGKQVFHLGPVGAGHAMKCINNLITALTFMATAEGLVLGKKFGLDPNVMTEVLNGSTGMSWISRTHIRERITSRKFDDPFKLELMVKDVGIALELARRTDLQLPLAGLGRQLWETAGLWSEKGGSISNMVRWVEHMTGTEITPGSGW